MALKKIKNRRNNKVESVDLSTGKDCTVLMKRFTLVFCAAVLVLVGAGSVYSAPRLTMPESVFNFGYVPQNSTVSHVFWLYSTGDDTLKILSVKPG